jgi:GTP cyclohydrolase I
VSASRTTIEQAIFAILQNIEGDDIRPELEETPRRVSGAYEEMFSGYKVNIPLLFKHFSGGTDQLVIEKDIVFSSCCEHHLLPFYGVVHLGYLPDKRVIGASKMARLVDAYSHRLQLQERMVEQIADAMTEYLQPLGTAVIAIGTHECMRCRGAKSPRAKLVTSKMMGLFKTDRALRSEFLSLLRCAE